MKTYKLILREDYTSEKIGERYRNALNLFGMKEKEKADMNIVIGGDGTMIKAFHDAYHDKAHFLGIHTGTVGFYMDWNLSETEQLIDLIKTEKPKIVEYPLVEAEIHMPDGTIEKRLALNEIVIKSKTLSTFIMEVFLNKHHFETFRGDGMIFSTPSGSTAYNHSVHGCILHPSIETVQISEIASIKNKEFRTLGSSFAIPKHHEIELYIKNPKEDILIGIDNRVFDGVEIHKIKIKVADEKIKFLRYKEFPFWQRVKEKFLKE